MPTDIEAELREAVRAYGDAFEPVRAPLPAATRRHRRLAPALAVAAACALALGLASLAGGSDPTPTPPAFGPNPPYPDVTAWVREHRLGIKTAPMAYVVATGRLEGKTYRLIAWPEGDETCVSSTAELFLNGASGCQGLQAFGQRAARLGLGVPAPGTGYAYIGFARQEVLAVAVTPPNGMRHVVPAVKIPGAKLRVWALVLPQPSGGDPDVVGLLADGRPAMPLP